VAAHPSVIPVRRLGNWPRLGVPATLALALVLFAGTFVLRVSDPNIDNAEATLFLAPIAVLALRFGLRGGLAGALVAFALILAWGHYDHPDVTVIGYLGRGIAFLIFGALFGVFVDQAANNETRLETMVAERTRELDDARAETLHRLVIAAEYRDDETFEHTGRVGVAAAEIAECLGLGAGQIELLREAAPLHDIGKLAIPDSILLSPGKLSAQEWEVMQTHAALGADLLSGSISPVLQMAAVIAGSHHERWDGTGYPRGLTGEAIPLVGRVVAVADTFDALIHDRPYKRAWPVAEALAEIRRVAGSQLDPGVVAVFLTMHKDTLITAESSSPQQRERSTGTPRKPRRSPTARSAPSSAQYV
jgi:hypothetical protein